MGGILESFHTQYIPKETKNASHFAKAKFIPAEKFPAPVYKTYRICYTMDKPKTKGVTRHEIHIYL